MEGEEREWRERRGEGEGCTSDWLHWLGMEGRLRSTTTTFFMSSKLGSMDTASK